MAIKRNVSVSFSGNSATMPSLITRSQCYVKMSFGDADTQGVVVYRNMLIAPEHVCKKDDTGQRHKDSGNYPVLNNWGIIHKRRISKFVSR